MDFTFSEDQLLFQESVQDFLNQEMTPERIRDSWENNGDTGQWQALVEMGLTGVTVSEAQGGLGMTVLDYVLLAQACGYVALPEPLVHGAMVAVPVLEQLGGDIAAQYLPQIASGEAQVAVGLAQNLLVEDADRATLLLLERDNKWYALAKDDAQLTLNPSVDPSRRLFDVALPANAQVIAEGEQAQALTDLALDCGALAAAAQSLGLAQRMIDLSVAYTSDREQFGKPVGSFQAVKHLMANVAVRLEYAKAAVHRAAYAVANASNNRARAVSHAKLTACEAAVLAAKNSIQVHGAMGYTWEVDLHIFMKKAWALANTWGDAGFHKQRVANYIFSDGAALGAGATFNDKE